MNSVRIHFVNSPSNIVKKLVDCPHLTSPGGRGKMWCGILRNEDSKPFIK